MKILKYLLVLILFFVVAFFAMGLLNPTVDYGHTVTTKKSLKEAWAVSKDESKFAQWLDGYKSTELLSGEKWQIGAKSKIVVDPGEGQEEFEMIETLESVKEYDHVEMNFVNDMMDFHQRMSFSGDENSSTIKTESSVSGKGIVMRSMFAIMEMFGGSFQKQEELNINNLKKVIDENTTNYFALDSTVVE